jgi:hypothetical protein
MGTMLVGFSCSDPQVVASAFLVSGSLACSGEAQASSRLEAEDDRSPNNPFSFLSHFDLNLSNILPRLLSRLNKERRKTLQIRQHH